MKHNNLCEDSRGWNEKPQRCTYGSQIRPNRLFFLRLADASYEDVFYKFGMESTTYIGTQLTLVLEECKSIWSICFFDIVEHARLAWTYWTTWKCKACMMWWESNIQSLLSAQCDEQATPKVCSRVGLAWYDGEEVETHELVRINKRLFVRWHATSKRAMPHGHHNETLSLDES